VSAPTILWFRRDLRLRDHPALEAAAKKGPVTPLFVLDDLLLRTNEGPRTAFMLRTLRALDQDLRTQGGRLTVLSGRPQDVLPRLVAQIGASEVHISEDFAPYGRARDQQVEKALGQVPLVRTGSPYAVSPGQVVKSDGTPFKVFSPFYRAWSERGWHSPSTSDPAKIDWHPLNGMDIPADPPASADLFEAGEAAAQRTWKAFQENDLRRYTKERNRPDLDSSSHMSPHLKFGAIHPRTMLSDLGNSDDAYQRQLCWREFYAAVLHFWPKSAYEYFQPQLEKMKFDTGPKADERFAAWQRGETGFPIVDAGMRQLQQIGWMHNRLRLVVASFLVKDLHIDWRRGAKHFMGHLVDGDLANNQHGWQWTAGTGTDPAPFFRIFNPTLQAKKFDPNGDYVRRYVPELKSLSADEIHEPWKLPAPPADYPAPIVDHDAERKESLARYEAL
jgi:deoxyribodipyrimidine photo-lyase